MKNNDKESPFCFWVGTFEPHRGYTRGFADSKGLECDQINVPKFLPPSKEIKEDICEYFAEIEHIDDQIGKIMQTLEKIGKAENTFVIFTSDNGMPFPRSKATLYDYGTRMPFIVWWGKNIEGDRQVNDLISFTDIAPTILDVAGIESSEEMDGRSILPYLDSKNIIERRHSIYMYRLRHGFYPDMHGKSHPARAIRTNDYLFIWNLNTDTSPRDVDGGPAESFMVKNKEAFEKLYNLSFGKRQKYEFYKINNDLYQINNLANKKDFSLIRDSLNKELLSYLELNNDPRVIGEDDSFLYNPYFGWLFQEG